MNAEHNALRESQSRIATTIALGRLQDEVAEVRRRQDVVLSHVTSQTYFGVRSPLPMLALAFSSAALFGVLVLSTAFAFIALRAPTQTPTQTTAQR